MCLHCPHHHTLSVADAESVCSKVGQAGPTDREEITEQRAAVRAVSIGLGARINATRVLRSACEGFLPLVFAFKINEVPCQVDLTSDNRGRSCSNNFCIFWALERRNDSPEGMRIPIYIKSTFRKEARGPSFHKEHCLDARLTRARVLSLKPVVRVRMRVCHKWGMTGGID